MEIEKFYKLVEKAFEELPDEFKIKLENVEIIVEEKEANVGRREILLGLYEGIPLKKRGVWYHLALPDKIILYKKNIEDVSKNEKEIEKMIKDVLYHEIGHHFGLSEEELKRMKR